MLMRSLKGWGYREMAERLGVDLVNLSKDKRYEVMLEGHYFETLKTIETLLRATRSVPNLKYAEKTKTGTTKPQILGDNIEFKFIPFYSYWIQRISLNLSKTAHKLSRYADALSKFLSQAGGGLMV